MGGLSARLLGVGAAAGLALAGAVMTAAPAQAAACSGSTGVTVVIDTGSSVSTRCASGDPSSALSALSAVAGVTQVQTQPGFVCRIDGVPSSDPCVRTPPASAYWAFYHAPRGGSWTYSNQGVASYDPSSGSVIGFRFGSGQQPRVAPPAVATTSTPKPAPTRAKTSTPRTTTSAPKTTTKPRTTSAPRTTAPSRTSGGSATTGAPETTGPSTSTTPSGRPSASPSPSDSASPTASGSDSGSATPSPTASEDDVLLTAAGARTADGSGASDEGAGTLLAGGGLVALVAAGAGWTMWRRRV